MRVSIAGCIVLTGCAVHHQPLTTIEDTGSGPDGWEIRVVRTPPGAGPGYVEIDPDGAVAARRWNQLERCIGQLDERELLTWWTTIEDTGALGLDGPIGRVCSSSSDTRVIVSAPDGRSADFGTSCAHPAVDPFIRLVDSTWARLAEDGACDALTLRPDEWTLSAVSFFPDMGRFVSIELQQDGRAFGFVTNGVALVDLADDPPPCPDSNQLPTMHRELLARVQAANPEPPLHITFIGSPERQVSVHLHQSDDFHVSFDVPGDAPLSGELVELALRCPHYE